MRHFLFLLLAVAGIGLTRTALSGNQQMASLRVLIPPPPMISHFVFGFDHLVADLLWIRSIQDFDYCEAQGSDQRCHEGWLFQMLDTITDLSPDLRLAYSLGATSLSVLVNDIEGASRLFDKGVRNMPGDWPIAFRAAYHYMYEVGDMSRAAELMWRAARNGAPDWTYSLAARLYTQEGQRELGLRLLLELERSGTPKEVVDRMRAKIDEVPTLDHPQLDDSE